MGLRKTANAQEIPQFCIESLIWLFHIPLALSLLFAPCQPPLLNVSFLFRSYCCRKANADKNDMSYWKYSKTLYVQMTTVKCHYNACHYNANASLTRSILGSQTAPTCPHNHSQVAQHMGKRCEIIAVWSATAAMTPLCSHTNGIKQRHPTCWLCQYSRFMIDLRSNTLIIHLRCSENAIIRPIWLLDALMLKTIPVAIKLT